MPAVNWNFDTKTGDIFVECPACDTWQELDCRVLTEDSLGTYDITSDGSVYPNFVCMGHYQVDYDKGIEQISDEVCLLESVLTLDNFDVYLEAAEKFADQELDETGDDDE